MKHAPILSILALLTAGCAAFENAPTESFDPGRYSLDTIWNGDATHTKSDILIVRNGLRLTFILPFDGSTIFTATLKNGKFHANINAKPNKIILNGEIVSKNRIEGVGIMKREETVQRTVKFAIYPSATADVKHAIAFLPLLGPNTPKRLLAKKIGFRKVVFAISKTGRTETLENFETYNPKSPLRRTEIPLDELKKHVTEAVRHYGVDIPFHVYADKDATVASLARILSELRETGKISRFRLLARQQRWEGLYSLTILPPLPPPGYHGNPTTIKITKDAFLVDGKPIEDVSIFLAETKPEFLAVDYSGDATVQQLAALVALVAEHAPRSSCALLQPRRGTHLRSKHTNLPLAPRQ